MQPVGKHFAKIAHKVYADHGQAWAGLLSNWREIAGAKMAEVSQPQKISWPSQKNHSAADIAANKSSRSSYQKIGGILTLRVAYGRALEFQHTAPQIIDRINAYYGYSAIAQLKITQGKIAKQQKPVRRQLKPLNQQQASQLDQDMSGIDNSDLKSALSKLATSVLTKSTN